MPMACPQAYEWKHLSSQGRERQYERRHHLPPSKRRILRAVGICTHMWSRCTGRCFSAPWAAKSQLLGALRTRRIDAVARGIAGNTDAVQTTSGAFVVMAVEDVAEQGGSSVTVEDATVAMCPNEMIDCLTRGRCFGCRDRRHDPWVFRQRALL